MSEDRSLDDFVAGSRGGEGGDEAETHPESAGSDESPDGTADADGGSDADDTDAPTPAVATYRWDPDGVECAACGESAERLWNADDGFVCESCKEW